MEDASGEDGKEAKDGGVRDAGEDEQKESPKEAADSIVVYVCGKVRKEGVVTLPAGSRIYQAIEMAGGMADDAAASYLNLAEVLTDGARVYVPGTDDAEVGNSSIPQGNTAGGFSGETDGKVNINQASKEELMTLPGIGEVKADAIIDFSNAAAVDGLLDYCVEKQIPVVLCTTGLSEEQLKKVEETSKKVAVLKSANMSLGVNMLLKLLQDATKVLAPVGFDIEIVEKHHNQKVDAPSGTALAMADSMNEVMENAYTYNYDRSQVRQKREKKEIGISAVRGGTIVGEHEVIFAGEDEVIEFIHTAYSKAVFAKGAVEAGKFLKGKGAGLYDMSDVIQF